MEYGASFQRLHRISVASGEALLTLQQATAADKLNADEGDPTFLIDAGLHGAIAAFCHEGDELWLPVAAEKISLHEPSYRCRFIYVSLGDRSADQIRMSAWFCDAEGRVILHVDQAAFKRKARVNAASDEAQTIHFAIENLMPDTTMASTNITPHNPASDPFPSAWICADDDFSTADIKRRFAEKSVVVLRESDDFAQISAAEAALSLLQKTHIEKLTQAYGWPDMVIRLTSVEDSVEDRWVLESSLRAHFYSWVQFVQHCSPAQRSDLCFCSVLVGSADYAFARASEALFKVIRAEYPAIRCAMIQVDRIDDSLSKLIEQELVTQQPRFTRYHDNRFLVSRYQLLKSDSLSFSSATADDGLAENALALKGEVLNGLATEAVVVIAGGSGAIGQQLGAYFLNQRGCRVALIGRRQKLSQSLETLRASSGGKLQYYAADIADQDNLHTVLKQIRREQGQVQGVIHAAGVLRDALLANKQPADMAEVFAAKIFGLHALDKLTEADTLKFFVVLSSLVGWAGSQGQADYAFANRAAELMIGMRDKKQQQGLRQGRSVSIALPYISGGGMRASEALLQRVAASTGLQSLALAAVPAVVEQAIQFSHCHCLVLPGKQSRIEQLLIDMSSQPVVTPKPQPVKLPSVADELPEHELSSRTQALLIQSAADVLEVEPELISSDSELGDFGFDSVLLTRFAANLSEVLGTEISPTQFFSSYTVDSMRDFLLQEHRAELLHSLDKSSAVSMTVQQSEPQPQHTAKTTTPSIAYSDVQPPVLGDELRTTRLPVPPQQSHRQNMAVAIVGIGVHLPLAKSPSEFWQLLSDGEDVIRKIPPERWDWRDVNALDSKPVCEYGGFIDDVERFDAGFFAISPLEAEQMDPQQRLLLQTVWHAIEDAGYAPDALRQSETGVYVGASTHDYAECLLEAKAMFAHGSTGTGQAFLANRISYMLDLCGPSQTIDTACSSSLVALSQACTALQQGVCKQAIVGGVNLMLTPTLNRVFSAAGMLSSTGRCRSFSADADGYVRGEGIVAVMLKRIDLNQAITDNVYAIVTGAAENHGGRANSLTAPNPLSQARVVQSALSQAGLQLSSLDMIETHGTGTSLGDPVEVDGLRMVLKNSSKAEQAQPLMLGALKTQLGHLEAAAGLAGVAKVALSLRNQSMPANLHCEVMNPLLKLEGTPFTLLNKARTWPVSKTRTRRAGISSFGIGGSNAHTILEEFQRTPNANEWPFWIFPVSAKTTTALQAVIEQLAHALMQLDSRCLPDISFTLCCGRNHYSHRRAFVVANIAELRHCLAADQGSIHYANLQSDISALELRQTHTAEQINATLSVLASEYCEGKSIDWAALPLFANRQRLSLPGYPFAGKSFWAANKTVSPPISTLPPLHLSADKRSAQLSIPLEHPLFTDHKVASKEVLPGAVWVCLFQRFAQLAGLPQTRIENLTWHLPIFPEIAESSSVIDLSITALARANRMDLSVLQQGKKYVSAHLLPSNIEKQHKTATPEVITAFVEKDRPDHRVDLNAFNRALSAHGLHYGAGFRVLSKAVLDSNVAIAKLSLPALWPTEDTPFHPSLIDGAMQLTALLHTADIENNSSPSVPYKIDAIELFPWEPVEQVVYARAEKSWGGKNWILNVAIFGEQGQLLAQMENIHAHPLSSGVDKSKKIAGSDILMFKPRWAVSKQSLDAKQQGSGRPVAAVHNTNLLLLERTGELSAYLRQHYPDSNIRTASLAGDQFKQGEQDYTVDLSQGDAIETLLDHYLAKNNWPDQIIHYWSSAAYSQGSADMRVQLDHGVKTLMKLVKSLARRRQNNKSVHILYVYPLNGNPLYSAVAAFASTVNAETQAVSMAAIGVEEGGFTAIEYELSKRTVGEFQWRNGERRQRYFEVINHD